MGSHWTGVPQEQLPSLPARTRKTCARIRRCRRSTRHAALFTPQLAPAPQPLVLRRQRCRSLNHLPVLRLVPMTSPYVLARSRGRCLAHVKWSSTRTPRRTSVGEAVVNAVPEHGVFTQNTPGGEAGLLRQPCRASTRQLLNLSHTRSLLRSFVRSYQHLAYREALARLPQPLLRWMRYEYCRRPGGLLDHDLPCLSGILVRWRPYRGGDFV